MNKRMVNKRIIISLALNCNDLVIFQFLITRIVNIYLEGAEKLSMIEKTKDMRLQIFNLNLHYSHHKVYQIKRFNMYKKVRSSEFEFNLK